MLTISLLIDSSNVDYTHCLLTALMLTISLLIDSSVVVPCVCVYVCMCVHSNLPPHTLESQKRDTNGFIAIREQFLKGDLKKHVLFKSYGIICLPRAAPASYRCFIHEISFYASFEAYSYVFTAQTTGLWKTACDSLAQTRERHRYTITNTNCPAY